MEKSHQEIPRRFDILNKHIDKLEKMIIEKDQKIAEQELELNRARRHIAEFDSTQDECLTRARKEALANTMTEMQNLTLILKRVIWDGVYLSTNEENQDIKKFLTHKDLTELLYCATVAFKNLERFLQKTRLGNAMYKQMFKEPGVLRQYGVFSVYIEEYEEAVAEEKRLLEEDSAEFQQKFKLSEVKDEHSCE